MKTEIAILTFQQNVQFNGSTKKTRMVKIWRDTKRQYLKSLAQPFKIFAPEMRMNKAWLSLFVFLFLGYFDVIYN